MNIVAVNACVQRQFCAEMDRSAETPKENLTDVNCNDVETADKVASTCIPVEVWNFIAVNHLAIAIGLFHFLSVSPPPPPYGWCWIPGRIFFPFCIMEGAGFSIKNAILSIPYT